MAGGFQTCYVLIIKKALLKLENQTEIAQQPINRDTATVMSKIKTGLVLQLKDEVSARHIVERQKEIGELIKSKLADSGQENIKVLGNLAIHRLSSICFVIKNADTG